MGRFALNIVEDGKSRDTREKRLVSKILSAFRVTLTTTLLAYLIVLGWMYVTGDVTLWRLMGAA